MVMVVVVVSEAVVAIVAAVVLVAVVAMVAVVVPTAVVACVKQEVRKTTRTPAPATITTAPPSAVVVRTDALDALSKVNAKKVDAR